MPDTKRFMREIEGYDPKVVIESSIIAARRLALITSDYMEKQTVAFLVVSVSETHPVELTAFGSKQGLSVLKQAIDSFCKEGDYENH